MSTPFVPGLEGAPPPPLSLPGGHFALATAFLTAGAVGLVVVAPELAAGAWLSPRVTAIAHLFTLGWITTSIMGALYQFLPVALAESIRWPRVAAVTPWVYGPGVALFVAGLFGWRPDGIVIGAAVFGTAVLAFIVNLAATLGRARTRDVTWWALVSACVFLLVTLLLGWALSANLRWGFLGAERPVALGTHLHIALVGWVLMVMVGVGHRLMPMFLLSHGAGERAGKAAVALLSAGCALLFALHHVDRPVRRWIPATFILAGVAAFLVQARSFYRHRRRPSLDPGMRLAAAGLVVLGAGAALGVHLAVVGFASARLATAYVLLLVLGISLFVTAHHYKIVPFLIWYHRFGPLAGRRPVPKVAELYSARWADAAARLLFGGTLAMAAGTGQGLAPLTRLGAFLFASGVAVQVAQMAAVARVRPSDPEQPDRIGRTVSDGARAA